MAYTPKTSPVPLSQYDGADQIGQLNDLEHYRLRHLPLDHPVRQLWEQAIAAGYRRPPPEPASDGAGW